MNAFKVAVIESERGWGQKIDDYMITLTKEKAEEFIKEFNAYNDKDVVPDWYMRAEDTITDHTLTESQYKILDESEEKMAWWSGLKNI